MPGGPVTTCARAPIARRALPPVAITGRLSSAGEVVLTFVNSTSAKLMNGSPAGVTVARGYRTNRETTRDKRWLKPDKTSDEPIPGEDCCGNSRRHDSQNTGS